MAFSENRPTLRPSSHLTRWALPLLAGPSGAFLRVGRIHRCDSTPAPHALGTAVKGGNRRQELQQDLLHPGPRPLGWRPRPRAPPLPEARPDWRRGGRGALSPGACPRDPGGGAAPPPPACRRGLADRPGWRGGPCPRPCAQRALLPALVGPRFASPPRPRVGPAARGRQETGPSVPESPEVRPRGGAGAAGRTGLGPRASGGRACGAGAGRSGPEPRGRGLGLGAAQVRAPPRLGDPGPRTERRSMKS